MQTQNFTKSFYLLVFLISAACGSGGSTYSLMPQSATFKQSDSAINNKVDMLWVVDNSASMSPLQQTLMNNFRNFLVDFQTKNFDYQLAVTTSDAYLGTLQNNPNLFKFRDGAGNSHSGVFVINPNTVNPVSTFVTNANQGQTGSGDERVFSSLWGALSSNLNTGFVRQGSFLAVIILSDEDDFSSNTRLENAGPDHNYNDPSLLTVDSYLAKLDQLTNSQTTNRNYSVSAITVADNQCLQQHQQQAPSSIMGTRYIDMVNKTKGVVGSVCDPNFSNSLNIIQQRVLQQATRYTVSSNIVPSSIRVYVNGSLVPNDPQNGWIYDASSSTIVFNGNAIPSAGATIRVTYDPKTAR